MTDSLKLETGMQNLDRQFNGGLPAGSITVIEAPPDSQGYLMLHELTAERGTIWISFSRDEAIIETMLDETTAEAGDCTVRRVSDDEPMDDVTKLLTAVPDRSNILMEPMDVVESTADHQTYRQFLNDVQQHALSRESIVVLLCPKTEKETPLRGVTKYYADVVLELRTRVSGEDIENYLLVPKFRRGDCPSCVLKLDLGKEVSIDMSRDIA